MTDLLREINKVSEDFDELHQRLLKEQYLDRQRWEEWEIDMNKVAQENNRAKSE